jgi:hypothetical protein
MDGSLIVAAATSTATAVRRRIEKGLVVMDNMMDVVARGKFRIQS